MKCIKGYCLRWRVDHGCVLHDAVFLERRTCIIDIEIESLKQRIEILETAAGAIKNNQWRCD